MPLTSHVELVVFDLGRVLIRLCDGWRHACAVAGVAVPAGELTPEGQAALEAAVCASEVGEIGLEAFARKVAPHLGIEPPGVIALSNVYLRGTYPGAIELLAELRRAGVPTACLSNTNENHWRLITDPASPSFLPPEHLDHRFASHLVGMRKPDARIYAHVERQTGARPERIVFFDDLKANIDAARQRGWLAHQIQIDAADDDPIAQARTALRAHGLAV
jgi:putative hydrolase of the HAD superfamily